MGATNVTKEVVELSAIDNASKVIEGVGNAAKKLGATYGDLAGKLSMLGIVAGGVASFGGFAAMIKSTIEGEAALLRLAERTGSTVEALSSLGRVAKMSNTDMDEVGKGMQKLAKSMAEAESGTGKAGKVFQALGISIRDANTGALRPTQNVMQELGQKLMAMQDQTLAVAFAQEVLGKAGANLLPFLYELARAGELQVKVTTEQAKQAKEFEDNLVKLKGASMEFWRHLANDMLPTLNKYLEQMVEGKKIFGGWYGALVGAGLTNPLKSPGDQLKSISQDMEALKAGRDQMAGMPGYDAAVARADQQMAALEKQKRWFQFLQRQQVLEDAGTDNGDQVSRRFLGRKTAVTNPFGAEGGTTTPEKDVFGPALEGVQKLVVGYNKMSEAEKILWDIEHRRYADLTPAQKDELLNAAKMVDLLKLQQDKRAEQAAAEKAAQEKADAAAKAKLDAELLYAQALDAMRRGTLGEEENLETRVVGYQLWQAEIKKTDDVARQLGLTLSSAAGDAIRHWQGFGNLLKSVMLDIGQLVLKLTVLKPMEAGIEGWAKGLDISGWFSDAFGGGKATGGPVMNGTSYLVGEGGPEIFTPSSAGSITPNNAIGGGGTFYIDARGADAGGMARLEAMIRQVKGSIVPTALAAYQRANNMRGVATPIG